VTSTLSRVPRQPEPLVVEIVVDDSPEARAAQEQSLLLLIRWILEDRGAEIPDQLKEREPYTD
jgi:hypothetical protein